MSLVTTTSNDNSKSSPTSGGSGSASTGQKTTAKATQTSKGSSDGNKSDNGGKTTSRTVAQNAGAGGIEMITPAATAASSVYYSIGTKITWAWNYTSLVNPPQQIDILATVSGSAGNPAPTPFTIGTNVTWNKLQNFTWDTGNFAAQTPLPDDIYTLIVYDAAVSGGVTAVPVGGSLGVNKQFHFGMYNGQQYTALSNPYICATCNAGMGRMERMTLWAVFAMAGITVASFTWFAGGWGAFI